MVDAQDDFIERTVLNAINAVQSGEREEVDRAFEALLPLVTADVIAELFIWISDLTAGVSKEALLNATVLPLPPNPQGILSAVEAMHIGQLQNAVGHTDAANILASLLVLVASLKDARTRL